jgi:hypothetical protein
MSNATYKISSFKTARTFFKDGPCSTALMTILDRAYGHPLEAEELASSPLAGGIVQQGYQCGMLWGSVLAAGAQAYRLYGAGPKAEAAAMRAAERLVELFRTTEGEFNCLELTEIDMTKKSQVAKYFFKGGPVSCTRRAVRLAPKAFEVINAALAETDIEEPVGPASCAAELARRMGASERHAVMAAGLAGGIGISGGACGALGAAIWITGIQNPEEKIGFSAEGTKVGDAIERFLATSGHEYECAEIVGRKFEDTSDHARYVCAGGCSRILATLAGTDSDVEKLDSAA